MTNLVWFDIADVREKIRNLPSALTRALNENSADGSLSNGPIVMARDVTVVNPSQLPSKPGLSLIEGHARLLHDLASIELQAMELGVRTLVEFPEAPRAFREELAEIAMGEGRHLSLCLDGLEKLGYRWGHWNVHNALVNAVSHEDSLLDRILIVHRYLEGSGLDAGDSILKRLNGTRAYVAKPIVTTINNEEVDHVLFGSRWYQKICGEEGIDAGGDFETRILKIMSVVPRREKIAVELRKRAGFTEREIAFLESRRTELESPRPS